MIVMIDNYDSFTYNLVQYLAELGKKVTVFRNDKISVERIQALKPTHIVISPGPGRPEDAGISVEAVLALAGKVPILGVCLGHQALGLAFGAKIIISKRLMHGKTSGIYHDGKGLFFGLPNPFEATRYHSLLVESKSLPRTLAVTAWTKEKEIMGLKHKQFPLWGVQFHPESILTRHGKDLLANFLRA